MFRLAGESSRRWAAHHQAEAVGGFCARRRNPITRFTAHPRSACRCRPTHTHHRAIFGVGSVRSASACAWGPGAPDRDGLDPHHPATTALIAAAFYAISLLVF